MKKDQLYFYTFFGLTAITLAVSFFSMQYLFDVAINHFLKTHIESAKRQASDISGLVQYQIESRLPKDTVIKNLQKTFENSDDEMGFICVFDWSGVLISHPNPEKVGYPILPDDSEVQAAIFHELHPDDFNTLIKNKESRDNADDITHDQNQSEIVYLYPVKDTDWIVAAYANTETIKNRMNNLKINFILVYTASGILIVLLSLLMVRLISSKYEKMLESQNEGLSKELLSLSKLNYDLVLYKEKIDKEGGIPDDDSPNGRRLKNSTENTSKKRLLTYIRDEIVSIDTNTIAFIYTENTATYITCLDGKIYHSSASLDELYGDLDKAHFFRANRQFIIAIKAIEKIYKYGNNQLKIEMNPISPVRIIVSKNKASEFKRWLSQ